MTPSVKNTKALRTIQLGSASSWFAPPIELSSSLFCWLTAEEEDPTFSGIPLWFEGPKYNHLKVSQLLKTY